MWQEIVTRRQWKLRSVLRADVRMKSNSVRLRSGYRKQSLTLDGSPCRDLMLPLFPLFLFLEDVLWSLISLTRWVYYNGMDNTEWKPNMQDMQELILFKVKIINYDCFKKKEKCCWPVYRCRSETYCWSRKTKQISGTFFFWPVEIWN